MQGVPSPPQREHQRRYCEQVPVSYQPHRQTEKTKSEQKPADIDPKSPDFHAVSVAALGALGFSASPA
jgi:hypothetical protein